MDLFYLGILCFLLLLAVFDLSVGVANDAVNFLSPAVGARAAKFRTVLIVSAIGIFVGASTSSGMMDIARHGILQPTHYYFDDVMCIFLAVSASDVILLDIFNTLGMPTSTTVSMVFGLLGGSSALAMWKIIGSGLTYADLINTDKALSVIIGIFLSVAIAFVVGTVVMWIARVVFTFNYKKHLRWSIALYGGISITSIFFFLLTKGLGNSPMFQHTQLNSYLQNNQLEFALICLVVFTVLVEILHLFKVNIFKLIVLFGTFSLAMAFAGNDLVNFIGVPLAGLESFLDFTANHGATDATHYPMTALSGPSTLPGVQYFLIGAGIIMTIAICTSKKAQQVVQTSINLSRQDESEEVFSSSKVARKTVRSVLNANAVVMKYMPEVVKNWVNNRFNMDEVEMEEGVAFDLVRASVNLVLAGLLIVVGTSLQLPLSTTYVAFMVAMGSSLADRAWGRETAVYRITGVITVVGGWFITAGAAFILAFTIATLNHLGGGIAMLCVVAIIAFTLYNNNKRFKKKQETAENVDVLFRQMVRSRDKQQTWEMLRQHVADTQANVVDFARTTYKDISQGLMYENIKALRSAENAIKDEKSMWKRYRGKEILGMRKIDHLLAVEKNTWFHLGCNSSSQIIYGLKRMLEPTMEHVDNNFNPLPKEYVEEMIPICNKVDQLLAEVVQMIRTNEFTRYDEVLVEGNVLKNSIRDVRHALQDRIQREESNIKVSLLYLNVLQETQEIISLTRHLLRASKRFQQ